MRDWRARGAWGLAAVAVVAAGILLVIAVPRIPPAWSFVWGIWDSLSGGVEDRRKLLRDNPFPAELAPPGYRIEGNEEICDPDGSACSWRVSFVGPDDVNSIEFFSHAMIADEVYDYWRRGDIAFRKAFIPVDNLGSDSFCEQLQAVPEEHTVSCVAAFDGMAVIADSGNAKPERGSLEHAITLLRAGIDHWESINY